MKKLLSTCSLILALACLPGLAASPVGAAAAKSPAAADGLAGKVVETMNAATYTYVLVDTGAKKLWGAAPQFAAKVGDAVILGEALPMANYHSKSLNRTFDVVYFSGNVKVNGTRPESSGAAAELPKDHPSTARAAGPAAPDLSGIKRATAGQTVAEIHAGRAKFAGKPVAVRGRVVKFNSMILGKNWLHVRDGSGAEGTNDLTVTTLTAAKVGDLVLVTGRLATDRDFGGGYKYGLIVEDATVVVE